MLDFRGWGRVAALSVALGVPGCAGSESSGTGAATLGSGDGTTGGETDGESDPSASSAGPTTISASGSTDPDPTDPATTDPATTDATGGDDSSGDSGDSTGPQASWNRYSFDVGTSMWSAEPLVELWSGSNAPPPTGVKAAVSFTHFDRLWVLAEDDTFYERSDGVWQQPRPLSTRFPMTTGLDVTGIVHTPCQRSEDCEEVFFVANPVAVVYVQHENGGLDLAGVSDLMDEKDGPPQASGVVQWYFALADVRSIGQGVWLQWYFTYGDGNLWHFDNSLDFDSQPIGASPFFSGAPGEPPIASIRAAYYDDAFDRVHFIAP